MIELYKIFEWNWIIYLLFGEPRIKSEFYKGDS
jgi:hypothetical protein